MIKHREISERIIKAFYDVYNGLGHGFLEHVYQNALFFELQDAGLKVVPQLKISVHYKGRKVGKYMADMVVEDVIILELKSAEAIVKEHELQLTNYLKATEIEVGLLLNFGAKPEFRRKFWSNDPNFSTEVEN